MPRSPRPAKPPGRLRILIDRRVAFRIVSIYRIRDGKLAEFWGAQDEMTLREQLSGPPEA